MKITKEKLAANLYEAQINGLLTCHVSPEEWDEISQYVLETIENNDIHEYWDNNGIPRG